MEKDKKYNVILGIMILLFLIVIGIAIAWCLGVIGIKENNAQINDEKTVIIDNSTENKIEENVTNEESKVVDKMTVELAYGILNKYKAENLPDAQWNITNVTLVAHGDNDSYWVAYEGINYSTETPYEEHAGAIIEYKDGKWEIPLFGFTGLSSGVISTYNFINY